MRRWPSYTGTALFLILASLPGCEDNHPIKVEFRFDPQLSVVPKYVSMEAGDSIQFVAFFADNRGLPVPAPPGYVVVWESSDPDVAQVTADGKVLALARGQARIEVACGRYCATAMIWVSNPSAGVK